MNMNHIQLNTKDVKAAAEFYGKYFGFSIQKEHGDGLFLWNQHGFMMAVNPLPADPVFPSWFHLGFRLDDPSAVKATYDRFIKDQLPIEENLQEYDNFVFFRCKDPTGYVLEVFWEPGPNT